MLKPTRRDFLKILGATSLGVALPALRRFPRRVFDSHPNIIIIVLDALTSRNMSLYGYPRESTPNIERFAQHATVYHSHYSAGTFTSPGTSSLLTSMYPWTHRATNYSGLVLRSLLHNNIFNLFGADYTRIAFTQNVFADLLLTQFNSDIDLHLPPGSFGELELLAGGGDNRDTLSKYRAFDFYLLANRPGSLVFGSINKYLEQSEASALKVEVDRHELQYYERDLFFHIEKVMDGLASQLLPSQPPYLAYFHVYPPHEPYLPGENFVNLFLDDWRPQAKPRHPLLINADSNKYLNAQRLLYDQYTATVDHALGMFLNQLDEAGLFDTSYVIITSDHGQMFERGAEGHLSPLVYDSAIRIPLLISSPGQKSRRDILSVTNIVDVLPTLLNVTGKGIPEWCEGKILPGFGGAEDSERVTFSFDAKESPPFGVLSTVSIAMLQGKYKLIYYTGHTAYRKYPEDLRYNQGLFELYNMENDPEELNDLIGIEKSVAESMQAILLAHYDKYKKSVV